MAANGPAIGASVTSATTCDAILTSEKATFNVPFAALGIPPEGCSSIHFEVKDPIIQDKILFLMIVNILHILFGIENSTVWLSKFNPWLPNLTIRRQNFGLIPRNSVSLNGTKG